MRSVFLVSLMSPSMTAGAWGEELKNAYGSSTVPSD